MMDTPLFIVGSHRSGTTLLRVMLNNHPELSIPNETHFIVEAYERRRRLTNPQGAVRLETYLRYLQTRRFYRRWALPIEMVRERLSAAQPLTLGEAIAQTFLTLAARERKVRWGDKTPDHVLYIPLLARMFPTAKFVHLIRDGHNVVASGLHRGFEKSVWSMAHHWTSRVSAGRTAGRHLPAGRYLELRYETLVSSPEATLRELCDFAGLPFHEQMLAYHERADEMPDRMRERKSRLGQPPTPGLRNWRDELTAAQVAAFEAMAGRLLDELGYARGAERIPAPVRAYAWLYVAVGSTYHALPSPFRGHRAGEGLYSRVQRTLSRPRRRRGLPSEGSNA